MAGPRLSEECATVSGICGILPAFYPEVCRYRHAIGALCRLCGIPVVRLLFGLCVLH